MENVEDLQRKYDLARGKARDAAIERNDAFDRLNNAKVLAMEAGISARGIAPGAMVTQPEIQNSEVGIYMGCDADRFGTVRPDIRKIKKDGTAHATHQARIWLYSTMEAAPDAVK